MEGIVVPEPQVLESNSEVEVNQLADVEQSNNVHSSESLMPNISSDVVSTGDVSMAAIAASPSENVLNEEKEDCSQGADLDQVSSSTESFTGQSRDVLPSVNHQMVVIPNMEPYLEDGSLDGTSKELQDPTSTNGLAMEDNSNPDPTSNHVDSADTEVILLQENREDNLESNLNSSACQLSEDVLHSDSTETELNKEATPDEQVASCSIQLIEKSIPAICDNAPEVADPEEYVTVPIISEDVVSENQMVCPELEATNVEPEIADAESSEQFESIRESATANSATEEIYSEGDIINENQNLVTSLTETDMASHSEVSNSVVDCTTETSNEMGHEENVPESACQLLEVNEGLGEAVVLESDFADSSTLEIEERELVAVEPDASVVQQEDLHDISNQETNESFVVVEPTQMENGISVPEVGTVDSSVDDTIQDVDPTLTEGTSSTIECVSYERECIKNVNVEENVGADQADSGATESDFVDGGTAESEFVDSGTTEGDFVDSGNTEGDYVVIGAVDSELVNEEAMETDQIQAETVEGNIPTAEAVSIDEQPGEPDESQGITLDDPIATEESGVIYDDPVESGAIDEEATEAQSVDTQLMEAHLVEAQPVEGVRSGDEGVDSSYHMNSGDVEQPDGAIIEEVEASADIENPTSSRVESNYEGSEVENSELINMDTNMSNPTAVCEADSSAAGMEEPTYETQQMVDTQNVYIVEDGRLTLNSVQPSNSINTYHNADNAMLVEMAPLSTDGSYVDSQVSYVDAGQEGMITDAQAAELLMRVSEHRPMSLQSLQQDSSSSSGPYVQVQLAQTVDGITHLVEVPVSALAGYGLSSTLVYSTSGGGNSANGGSEMTWVQMHENSGNMEQHHLRTENKFSDIVSASIEAIGFPESSTPGANILSQAEQILIASENAAQESAAAAAASSNFEFDESSNSSITLINDKATTSYPRPKRESIESRIHKLLRGANAPALEVVEEPMQIPGKSSPRTLKLGPIQSPKPTVVSNASSPATVTLSLSPNQIKRPGRLVTATNSMGRTVTIPTVFTATNQSANKPPVSTLPPGSVDYFMPRGVSKRKAQTFKASKVNASNPNSIDVEPAPPEETQVKLAMGVDMLDEDDLHKDDDDFNRAVLLQARQRLQSEQGTNNKFTGRSSSSVLLSLPSGAIKVDEEDMTPAKRVRLSFPPEKYANLESVSSSYMAELQTPKLTYTIPRTRQVRPKIIKEAVSIDNSPKPEKEISVRLPWMDDEEELKRKRTPPRIIRQTVAAESKPKEVDVTTFDIDPDSEQSDQVIVIGLDETGQQPSEEQLTAIIQAAMTKRETSIPDRPTPPRPSPAPVASVNTPKSYSVKRKAADDENGVETEENGVRLKVIRTYDRGLGTPRKRPPRSKKLSTFLEIFEFEEDEEEDEDEEEVDDLERFSQALVDEENAIREKEKVQVQPKKPVVSPSKNAAVLTATYSRGRGGRGRGRAASHGSGLRQTLDAPGTIASQAVRGSRSRGRPPRGSKISFRSKTETDIADNCDAKKEASSEDDYGAYEDDDDDYRPVPRGRGRGRGRGQSRGKRGRPRSVSKEEPVIEAQEDEEEEAEDEEEVRIPGIQSKPCPQCDERFITREGFLEHIVVHSSAKCLMEMCNWVNPVSKEKTARLKREQLKQHMLSVHSESIPTA